MKVKRFFASDMRKALNQVRDEFGLDAVILSNRNQDQGIEIIAGMDNRKKQSSKDVSEIIANISPKSIEWFEDPMLIELKMQIGSIRDLLNDHLSDLVYSEYKRKNPIETSLRLKMIDWGISKNLSKKISDLIEKKENLDSSLEDVRSVISEIIQVYPSMIKKDKGIFAFFGHSGVGKTSTVLKMATNLAIQHTPQEIAFISTDNEKISAFDPLRSYSKIIDSQIKIVSSESDFLEALDFFSDKKFIFIDTPSLVGNSNSADVQESIFLNLEKKIEKFLVLDARDQYSNNIISYNLYERFKLDAAIITKLDETNSIGESLSVLMEKNMPVSFFSNGPKIPDHLCEPDIRRVINKFFSGRKSIAPELLEDISLVDLIGSQF